MYFTDDSLLPENQQPLMITAAPYGPMYMPADITPDQHLPITWKEQVQAAVDCYDAGATLLHIHVRDPKTGHLSTSLKEIGEQIARLRDAVPRLILQLSGSVSFAPDPGEETSVAEYDPRHRLADITPKPDQITVPVGSTLYDYAGIHPLDDSFEGTRFSDPRAARSITNLVVDATPDFYLEHIKRLAAADIQPYFALGHVHGLELVERLIRRGYYTGPLNGLFRTGAGGVCGVNPVDLVELVRRTPPGSCWTYQSTMRHTHPVSALMIALGQHTRAGIEDNLWDTKKGVRMSTLQMIERQVRMAKELGRPIATADEAREMLKLGVTYSSTEETLQHLGLPANRDDGGTGFPAQASDGRPGPAARGGGDRIAEGRT